MIGYTDINTKRPRGVVDHSPDLNDFAFKNNARESIGTDFTAHTHVHRPDFLLGYLCHHKLRLNDAEFKRLIPDGGDFTGIDVAFQDNRWGGCCNSRIGKVKLRLNQSLL